MAEATQEFVEQMKDEINDDELQYQTEYIVNGSDMCNVKYVISVEDSQEYEQLQQGLEDGEVIVYEDQDICETIVFSENSQESTVEGNITELNPDSTKETNQINLEENYIAIEVDPEVNGSQIACYKEASIDGSGVNTGFCNINNNVNELRTGNSFNSNKKSDKTNSDSVNMLCSNGSECYENEPLYLCEACGDGFITDYDLVSHNLNAHFTYYQQDIRIDDSSGTGKAFVCDKCPYRTVLRKHIKLHVLGHCVDKKFTCSLCSYKTARRQNLTIHLRTHSGVKPFACKFCSRKFSQKGNLNLHLRTHSDERPFSCYYCPYKTTRRHYLNLHELTHTGERPYKCDVCSRDFARKQNLKEHMSVHENKTYLCERCTYKTTHRVNFRRHVRSMHEGVNPDDYDLIQANAQGSLSRTEQQIISEIGKHFNESDNVLFII